MCTKISKKTIYNINNFDYQDSFQSEQILIKLCLNTIKYPEHDFIKNNLIIRYNNKEVIENINKLYTSEIHNIAKKMWHNLTDEIEMHRLGIEAFNTINDISILQVIHYVLQSVLEFLSEELINNNVDIEKNNLSFNSQSQMRLVDFWWNGIGNWMA